ncbi:UPF0711 protein C18orf21 homolog [Aulostomus maculatus]
MKTFTQQMSANFLLEASLLFKDRCPEQSRFLLEQHLKSNAIMKQKSNTVRHSTSVCLYCFQWQQPDNHRVRLKPKQRPSAWVQRVLRRKSRGKRLSLAQTNLLNRFQKSCSVLMATCHTCNKTSRHKGMNREFLAAFGKTHSTPGSAGRHKTPQSNNRSNMATPKTPGKDKTPVHTPRSSTSSGTPGSSGSKPASKAKNWVGRLSKILMREDHQSSKKGGLKDFLSSL